MKRVKKLIVVAKLTSENRLETAQMVAELENGSRPKWPVRFKLTGKKTAPKRR